MPDVGPLRPMNRQRWRLMGHHAGRDLCAAQFSMEIGRPVGHLCQQFCTVIAPIKVIVINFGGHDFMVAELNELRRGSVSP